MPEHSEPREIPFETILEALENTENPFPARYIYRLTDLSSLELGELEQLWPQLSQQRRQGLLEDMEILAESNFVLDFSQVSLLGVKDQDPEIRSIAIRSLWESDDAGLVPILISILNNDPSPLPKAQAANCLGHFIFLGELASIPENIYLEIIEELLSVYNNPEVDPKIQRNALESLGFANNPQIPELIEEAFAQGDNEMVASAIRAMANSLDPQWHSYIMENTKHSDANIRLEAIRAVGELKVEHSMDMILLSLDDAEIDVKNAAIWALSELGGPEADDALHILLDQTEDQDELDLLEDAVENIKFNQEQNEFNLFDFSEDDLEDLIDDTQIEDLPE